MSYNCDSSNLVECIQTSYPKRGQDWLMPVANIIRIMRKVLPVHAKIADDAKETIQQCVSEFISFITSEANDKCQREQRKTITADDILWAALKLGFDDYIEPLSIYLKRYREMEGDHRGSIRGEPLPLSLQMTKKDESDLAILSAVYSAECGMEVPASAYQASSSNGTHNNGNSCSLPIAYYGDGEKGATIPVAATYSHYRI